MDTIAGNHIKPIKSAQEDGIMYLLICVERENHTCTHRSRTIRGTKRNYKKGDRGQGAVYSGEHA